MNRVAFVAGIVLVALNVNRSRPAPPSGDIDCKLFEPWLRKYLAPGETIALKPPVRVRYWYYNKAQDQWDFVAVGTDGPIFNSVMTASRDGEYLNLTIQHITCNPESPPPVAHYRFLLDKSGNPKLDTPPRPRL